MDLLRELLNEASNAQRCKEAYKAGFEAGKNGEKRLPDSIIKEKFGDGCVFSYVDGYNSGLKHQDVKEDKKLSGANKAAYELGFKSGKAGKSSKSLLTVAALKKSFGNSDEVVQSYVQGYKDGHREFSAVSDHEAWQEKTAAKRDGRHYHESIVSASAQTMNEDRINDDLYYIVCGDKVVDLYVERGFKSMETAEKFLKREKMNCDDCDDDEMDELDSCEVMRGAALRKNYPKLFGSKK